MQQKHFLFLVTIALLTTVANLQLAAQNIPADTLRHSENVSVDTSRFAQNISSDSSLHPQKNEVNKISHPMNFVKINLTAIALKNYSIQYERILSRKFSIAVAYRTMPITTLPFKNAILKSIGNDDPQTTKTIEDFRLGNTAITPEVRFYLGKGYGRGFYIAAFYRYASFKSNDVNIFYTDDSGADASVKMSGKVTANTGGILFGMQHLYGKHIILDVWLLGPHYGSGTGSFSGVSSKPLSQTEQNNLKAQLEDIKIPLTNKTVNVNANGASLKLDGPWGGIRAGISLGVRF